MTYTPAQQRAIESDARYLCVDAGAGSGKTRVLVDRIVHLIAQKKAALEEVVAITFTEKAALEMKERLRRAFRARAPRDDAAAFSFWRDLERRVDTAHITTIRAFCSRLLRENALFLGLDPDCGMVSDAESALLMHKAIETTLLQLIAQEEPCVTRLVSEFSMDQLHSLCRALLSDRGVVDRIRRMGGLDTAETVLTAWRTVAESEQSRYLGALGRNPAINSFLLALRRFEGLCDDPDENRERWRADMVAGMEAVQAGMSPEDAEAVLRTFLRNPHGNGKKKLWLSEEVYDALSDCQKKVKEFAERVLLEGKQEYASEETVTECAQLICDLLQLDTAVNTAFERAKREAGLLDFDDLVLNALRVLRDDERLRERTARRIKYLLLDEFQDTDGLQLEIARLLHDADGGPALFIVGDPKQSIYYFRGAEVAIFQKERETAAELVELDRNFRSLPGVLGFANDFFARSNLLCAVERYHPMQIHRDADDAARVGFILTDPPEEVKWSAAEFRAAEAAQIAAEIRQLCGTESSAIVHDEVTGACRRPDFGDIALLFRKTGPMALYEEALRKAGIPFVVVAGAGFYERQEVVDVINLLKILADPWDEHALLAYLRGPIVALPDDDIVRICGRWTEAHPEGGLAERALGDIVPAGLAYPERLARARTIYARLRARLTDPLPDLVDHLLAITGLEAILLNQFLGLQKASNVRKFAAVAREQASRANLTLRQFVRYLDDVHVHAVREGEAGLQPDGQGAVTLMTMHKSKGLEFPCVFLPDLAELPRPSREHTLKLHRELGITLRLAEEDGERADTLLGHFIRRRIKEEEDAEAARLLYVALTRARDYLYLCGKSGASLGTWFHAFDAIYRITDHADGAIITGKDWKARVLRTIPGAPAPRRDAATTAAVDLATVEKRVQPVEVQQAALRSLSISQLLDCLVPASEDIHVPPDEGYPRVERDPAYAMDRGTLVHRMFECWDFAKGNAPDVPALVRAAAMGLGHRAQLEADLRHIQQWFVTAVLDGAPGVSTAVRTGAHRQCARDERDRTAGFQTLGERLKKPTGLLREHPFSLRIGTTLVNGTIDLALADGTIVDYKTGRMKKTTATRYETQLLLYAAAMRALTGTTPATGILVYVDAGEVVEVALTPARVDAVLDACHEALSGPQKHRA